MSLIFREIITGLQKPRSGWVIRDIPEEITETVFQHVSKVVKAARIYGRMVPGVDGKKLVKMARGHDTAEYKEKDYMPDEITKEEKFLRERAVIEDLIQRFPGKFDEVYALWLEFEEGKTVEAIATRQLDIMDAGVQALQYLRENYDKVHDFIPWTQKKLTDPLLIKIWDILTCGEFSTDFYYQYISLLELGGDREHFREKMMSEGLGGSLFNIF